MEAAVLNSWKKIDITKIDEPELEKGECLIKVKFAGLCGSDIHVYEGKHPTATTPVILGHEIYGEVVKINEYEDTERRDLQIGDNVVLNPLISCGNCEACKTGYWHVCKDLKLLGIHENGGFAEYTSASIQKTIKANNLPPKIAAMGEPFAVGVHVNRRSNLNTGDDVLVIGGGPIGIVTGLVAQFSGARRVIFSEIDIKRKELLEEFGFTVINPERDKNNKKISQITDEKGFDIVFETSGSQAGIKYSTENCKIRGKIIQVGFPNNTPNFDHLGLIFKELQLIGSRVYTQKDFEKASKILGDLESKDTINLEKLISNVVSLKEIEKGINIMKQGKNLGKILIKTN